MKRYIGIAVLCSVCFFLLPVQSTLLPQEKQGKAKPNPNSVEGWWTELISEGEMGGLCCMLPERNPTIGQMGPNAPTFWKINKETIEVGWDVKDWFPFPQDRYKYKLNPDRKEGAIDLNLDAMDLHRDIKNRRKLSADGKKTQFAIYYVSGDYLMLCIGWDSRPKSFTSGSKKYPSRIHILRRGKMTEWYGEDLSKPKRKEK